MKLSGLVKYESKIKAFVLSDDKESKVLTIQAAESLHNIGSEYTLGLLGSLDFKDNKWVDSVVDIDTVPVYTFEEDIYQILDGGIVTGLTDLGLYLVECGLHYLVLPAVVKEIPVIRIATNSFRDLPIEIMELSEGLKEIGSFAFANTKLLTIHLPNTVIEVDEGAFKNCFDLKDAYLSNVQLIENEAFSNCSNLDYVSIGYKIKYIAKDAFKLTNTNIDIDVPKDEVYGTPWGTDGEINYSR